MKQLLSLFLFLVPCLALAQYPSNGNQKITLGEQTTADGLIFRGAAADTASATLKITKTNKQDTSTYLLLDTLNNVLLKYNIATTYWTRLNLLPTDTSSMLTNYYRSGRTGIIQASDVPTLNQNTTGSAATLTTSRTFQTNLASTLTASFNGSANVTPGVTGTLPVANGGTNASTFTAGSVVFAGSGGTYTQDNSNFFWNNSAKYLGIGTTSPDYNITLKRSATQGDNGFRVISTDSTASTNMILDVNDRVNERFAISSFGKSVSDNLMGIARANNSMLFKSGGLLSVGTRGDYDFILASNDTERMRIKNGGEVYIAGTTDRGAYNLQVNGTGVWGEGAYFNGSDANIKENITNLDSSLNIINNLKPVVFNYINTSVNNDTKHLGFIAQDVYQTLENKDYLGSIVRSDGETLSIAYSNIIPLLTKAIQEQQALIKALEQRIINLENK
jgi:hypothetical protein